MLSTLLPSPRRWETKSPRCRRETTASPTSTAVSLSDVNAAQLPSCYELENGRSAILQPVATNFHSELQYSGYDLSSRSPSPLGPGLYPPHHSPAGLDGDGNVIEFFLHDDQVNTVRYQVGVHPQHSLLPLTPVLCQEIPSPSPASTDAAVKAAPSASPSRKSKAHKEKTVMCKNKLNCPFHKTNRCKFAHNLGELRLLTYSQLQETKEDSDYLSLPCVDYVMNGSW